MEVARPSRYPLVRAPRHDARGVRPCGARRARSRTSPQCSDPSAPARQHRCRPAGEPCSRGGKRRRSRATIGRQRCPTGPTRTRLPCCSRGNLRRDTRALSTRHRLSRGVRTNPFATDRTARGLAWTTILFDRPCRGRPRPQTFSNGPHRRDHLHRRMVRP